MKKIIASVLMLAALLAAFSAPKPVMAQPSETALHVQIQSLIARIISLLRQLLQMQLVQREAIKMQTPVVAVSSAAPVLTVKVSGTKAYVSINNGPQFEYSQPITLKEGDSYKVTAEKNEGQSSSKSVCSGTVFATGSYSCNISSN